MVAIPAGLKRGANVRKAGEDVKAGEAVLEAGAVLRPQDLAALASLGFGEVDCFQRLKVAIVSTGDEVERGRRRALAAGQVFDANAPMLGAADRRRRRGGNRPRRVSRRSGGGEGAAGARRRASST